MLRRLVAGTAAAVLACAGLLALTATPAAAASTYTCKLSFTTTNPLPKWTPNVTMKASPASPKAGQKVTVTVNVGTYTNGPVTLAKGKLKPQGSVALSGAQSGTFRVTGPAVNQVVGALKKFPVPTMTGSFTAKSAGSVNLNLKNVQFVYPGPPPVTTTCTAPGSGDPMGSLKVVSTGGGGDGGGSGDGGNGGGAGGTGGNDGGSGDGTGGAGGGNGGGNGGGGGGGKDGLAETGATNPMVWIAGLAALQLGLIVAVRASRAMRWSTR